MLVMRGSSESPSAQAAGSGVFEDRQVQKWGILGPGESSAAGRRLASGTQLPAGWPGCPGVGSLWAVCPQNQSHFLGDPGVAQLSCFWHSRGGRKPKVGPTEASPPLRSSTFMMKPKSSPLSGAVKYTRLVFENVKKGREDKVSIT